MRVSDTTPSTPPTLRLPQLSLLGCGGEIHDSHDVHLSLASVDVGAILTREMRSSGGGALRRRRRSLRRLQSRAQRRHATVRLLLARFGGGGFAARGFTVRIRLCRPRRRAESPTSHAFKLIRFEFRLLTEIDCIIQCSL